MHCTFAISPRLEVRYLEVRPLRGSWVWLGLEAGVPRIRFVPLEGDEGPGTCSFWAMGPHSKEVHLQTG